MSYFEAFGRALTEIGNPTVAAGRYASQAGSVESIVADVVRKLDPRPSDRLLEIGFGSGQLLLPLSKLVRETVGIDHPAAVQRLADRAPANVTLAAGQWPEVGDCGKFDRVLVYSVLHYVEDEDAAREFVAACVDVLSVDGVLLLGDLPNSNRKRDWPRALVNYQSDERFNRIFMSARGSAVGSFGDAFVLDLVAEYRRRRWFEAFVLPQPFELPFSRTREDILIRRPA